MTDLFDDPLAADDADSIVLSQYAEQAYLDYAVSVVKGRALPDLRDGQKPVQRRILYAMQAMGLAAGAKPVKSARVVGDVLGKYHPHGDQAAYDALVRMAQSFSLRYPLIDGQGNFGSRDGDNAAAMRYTEARLTPIARLLLDELGQGTVQFVPNYDGSQEEPQLLPARLPMVLLNGASGIAVGMATEIPAHNLGEVTAACVALLRDPALSDDELMTLLPGPDFAGGGQIITPAADIAALYRTGRGSLKARARWHIEEMARGQWQWVVDELPPGTSCQKVLEEIEELTNPRLRAGRKQLTPEQQQTKARVLALLDTVRDESGKDAAVRLVFEPKTSKVDRDGLITALLALTSLESNVSVNLVMVGTDGRPRQKHLREILTEWLGFRAETVLARSRHQLARALDRIHVLEGRLIVHLNIDEVIRTLREADEPREALMARFDLTERQADDILDMRLRQLARLEHIRIERELEGLRKEAADLQATIDQPNRLKRQIIRELEADAKQYGDARRTLIETAERAVVDAAPVVDEPVTVIASTQGWLRLRQGHGLERSGWSFKAGDSLAQAIEARSTDMLVVVGSDGRVYSLAVASLPSGRGDGVPVTSLVDLEAGTRPVDYLVGAPASRWLFATTGGLGFAASLGDLQTRRGGRQFVTLGDDDSLLGAVAIPTAAQQVALRSTQGRFLVFGLDEVRVLAGGGRGTQLMGLDAGDTLAQVIPLSEAGLQVSGVYRKREYVETWAAEELQAYVGKRARKGRKLEAKGNEVVLAAAAAAE